MPHTKPPYPVAFRQQMIELVRAERKLAALAGELGCNVSNIHVWIRQVDNSRANREASVTALDVGSAPLLARKGQKLLELYRKFKQAQMKRNVLARACHCRHTQRAHAKHTHLGNSCPRKICLLD